MKFCFYKQWNTPWLRWNTTKCGLYAMQRLCKSAETKFINKIDCCSSSCINMRKRKRNKLRRCSFNQYSHAMYCSYLLFSVHKECATRLTVQWLFMPSFWLFFISIDMLDKKSLTDWVNLVDVNEENCSLEPIRVQWFGLHCWITVYIEKKHDEFAEINWNLFKIDSWANQEVHFILLYDELNDESLDFSTFSI